MLKGDAHRTPHDGRGITCMDYLPPPHTPPPPIKTSNTRPLQRDNMRVIQYVHMYFKTMGENTQIYPGSPNRQKVTIFKSSFK
jgi:hypothetical protein